MENKENTQPKFTPGPWLASGQLIFAESKKHPIAAVDGLWLLTGNTFEANAALIAAAPEMYAVLERAYEALWNDGYMYTKSQGLRADISTVLAKARGKVKR